MTQLRSANNLTTIRFEEQAKTLQWQAKSRLSVGQKAGRREIISSTRTSGIALKCVPGSGEACK